MFWWYNMYSTVDISATPRPMYPADGRKIPDHYAEPPELRDELNQLLGTFPLFTFWGPMTSIEASSLDCARDATCAPHATADADALLSCRISTMACRSGGPTRHDPRVAQDLRDIDAVAGELIEEAERNGDSVIVVSEYGIVPVREAVHINRALRQAGLVRVRNEMGRELLDPGASKAFAVADHQVAHVYLQHGAEARAVKRLLESVDGVAQVLDEEGKRAIGLDHPRSGELVALSAPDRWFSYYWWLDDAKAPDYARTVDIHRKPGYDPMELFVDPAIALPKLKVARRLIARKLGFRNLLDVTPINDTAIVKGSHGLITAEPERRPRRHVE